MLFKDESNELKTATVNIARSNEYGRPPLKTLVLLLDL